MRIKVDGMTLVARVAWAGLFSVALLAGCGGSEEGIPAPATDAESAAVGTIEDVEPLSVLVSEAQFDTQTAEALDDDEQTAAVGVAQLDTEVETETASLDTQVQTETASPDTQVQIETASRGRSGAVDWAARVAFGTSVIGSVESVNAAAKQIKVLGQTIQVSAGTVFAAEIKDGLAGVTVGSILDVHGLLDAASGTTSATRIELRKAADFFLLRGVVSQVNITSKTLRVGGQPVSLAKLPERHLQRLAQANGKVIRAVLEAKQVSNQFVARGIRGDSRFVADGKTVDIEKIVTEVTSNAAFKLFGLPVDASKAAFVNPTLLKPGARVQVRGALTAGVLVASNVSVKLPAGRFQSLSTVAALDAMAQTFTLDGIKIDFSGNRVIFENLNAAALVNGARVSVRGKVSADGTFVLARRIQFQR